MTFKKGQHVVCKYNGSQNGDLIVGRVESVRTNGDILLINLLSDSRSVKKQSVLSRRNRIVSKKQAMHLVAYFKRTGDKSGTRRMAVESVTPIPVLPKRTQHLEAALHHFYKLNEEEKHLFVLDVLKNQFKSPTEKVS